MDAPALDRAPVTGGTGGTVDQVTSAVLADLVRADGVARVGLALIEGGGRRLHFTASDREGPVVDWCLVDAYDDVPLTTAVRTGAAVLGALDDLDDRYRGLVERQREAGVVAIAALPLAVDGGPPLGAVVLFFDAPQRFDDARRDQLDSSATVAAAAIRAAQAVAPRVRPAMAQEPTPDGARVLDAVVDPDPREVGGARRLLRRALEEWEVDDDVAGDALLCLSEVVTNAVVHTGAPSEVRVTLDRGLLTTVVRDAGARHRPQVSGAEPAGPVDPLRVHGRGLALVAELSDRWGSELDAAGTTVWFELDTRRAG